MNIKKGDQIKMLGGKDRGKTGTVLNAYPEDGRISVEGINIYKKRVRPKRQGQKGETVLLSRPFPVSKAELICSICKKPTRVGFRMEGNRKTRYCKKCQATT